MLNVRICSEQWQTAVHQRQTRPSFTVRTMHNCEQVFAWQEMPVPVDTFTRRHVRVTVAPELDNIVLVRGVDTGNHKYTTLRHHNVVWWDGSCNRRHPLQVVVQKELQSVMEELWNIRRILAHSVQQTDVQFFVSVATPIRYVFQLY